MRFTVAAAAICASLIGLTAPPGSEAAIRKFTQIPAERLEDALQALARDRGLIMAYRSEVVGDRRTHGASGELTPEEALKQLLGDTGLTYSLRDNKIVTIAPLNQIEHGTGATSDVTTPINAHGAASPQEEKSFAGTSLLAQADSRSGSPIPAVSASSNSTGARSGDAELGEIVVTAQKRAESAERVPISMSVLSGKDLDKSTAESVADVLNTVPAVSTLSSYQGGGTLVTIRGVSAGEALLNGAGTVGYYLDSVLRSASRKPSVPMRVLTTCSVSRFSGGLKELCTAWMRSTASYGCSPMMPIYRTSN